MKLYLILFLWLVTATSAFTALTVVATDKMEGSERLIRFTISVIFALSLARAAVYIMVGG